MQPNNVLLFRFRKANGCIFCWHVGLYINAIYKLNTFIKHIKKFALGWWAFIDGLAILWNLQDRKVAPGIEDWAPGIITTLGMIV